MILYDADITVNLEFQTKFSQYCDDLQVSKLLNLINTEYNKDICEEDNHYTQYVFDEKNFEIEDMDSVEFKIEHDFVTEFVTSVFGKVINNL